MKDIFVSRPTWIPNDMQPGMDNFYKFLEAYKLNPRTIGTTDYPNECPLDEVINLMNVCFGTIILGIPQIVINTGLIKNVSLNERTSLCTEWNHIEAGLAYSLGHPLLLIHHVGIRRGIFDRGASNSFLHEVDMLKSDWALSNQISGVIKNWTLKLTNKPKLPKNGKVDKQKPTIKWGMYKFDGEEGLYCPSCYEKDNLKILASRVNSKYYKCPNCKAELS